MKSLDRIVLAGAAITLAGCNQAELDPAGAQDTLTRTEYYQTNGLRSVAVDACMQLDPNYEPVRHFLSDAEHGDESLAQCLIDARERLRELETKAGITETAAE